MRRVLMKKSKGTGLMLTPLLDMFTIILIFLIVSFQSEDYDFKLDEKLTLPESMARSQFKPGINLSARPDGVTVEREKVIEFSKGRGEDEWYKLGEIPKLVQVLDKYYDALAKAGAVAPADAEAVEEGAEPPNPAGEIVITIQADRRLDYQTLYLIMRSAAKAGFFKYRLAVLRK